MPASKQQPKIDPELIRQIDAAAADTRSVEAVLMLRQDLSQIAAHPERTQEMTKELLKRVKNRVGSGPKQVHVFQNIGSFIVAAEPSYLRELLAQPEIATAVANRQPDQAKTPPIKDQITSRTTRRKDRPVARQAARRAKGAAGKR